MRKSSLVLLCPILIGAAPPSPDAKLKEIIAPVSGAQMKRTVEKLVSFGTRHTLSSQTDPKRGIGAALNWTKGQFESFGLPTDRPCDTVTGKRVPNPTRVCDMIAIQRGTERPNDVVIIQGHIDSRVTDVMNFTSDAPGANDDGSGTSSPCSTTTSSATAARRMVFATTSTSGSCPKGLGRRGRWILPPTRIASAARMTLRRATSRVTSIASQTG